MAKSWSRPPQRAAVPAALSAKRRRGACTIATSATSWICPLPVAAFTSTSLRDGSAATGRAVAGVLGERFGEDALPTLARRTARLESIVHHLALALGGRPGANFTKRVMLPVSGDTLPRVVRRTPSRKIGADPPSVRAAPAPSSMPWFSRSLAPRLKFCHQQRMRGP